jgi:recombination protein RecR
MKDKLPTLDYLLRQLQQMPYVASRHIYRVAHHFLEMDAHKLQQFCVALQQAKEKLVKCPICYAWKENAQACLFCGDTKRDQRTVCVVETWYDLWAIERTESYKGVYHVLGGSICPLYGMGPDDLTISSLIERADHGCDEIILALNQTPEGEATSAYIARKLEKAPVRITCLARGVPVGSSLEMLDRLTVHKALNERRPF